MKGDGGAEQNNALVKGDGGAMHWRREMVGLSKTMRW